MDRGRVDGKSKVLQEVLADLKSPHQLKIRMAVFGSGSVRSRQKEVRVFLHFPNISNDNHHIQVPPKNPHSIGDFVFLYNSCDPVQEELLASGDPKYAHLRQPLFLQVDNHDAGC